MAEENYSLFNINLEFDDWRGPFKDIDNFFTKAELALPFKPYVGSCSVRKDGKLFSIEMDGLHTYKGSFCLLEDDHIHLTTGGKNPHRDLDMQKKDDGIYLSGLNPDEKPIYTLNGLYSTLESSYSNNGSVSERLEAMICELEKHDKINNGEELGLMTLEKT